jgi:DNA replication protein DnaC
LAEAQDKYQLRRLEQAINKAALLIIDDLSYITFNRRHSELLFKLIAERTERASIIISTNLEFSRWTELFEDPMLTAALVDRLTYKAHILNMNGESYRFKHRQPSKE